jgi:hypothetical protein
MTLRALIGGLAALASIAGAAVAFLWQGIIWLQSSSWPKVSVATALRWLDGRSWVLLVRDWPQVFAWLDAVPLSLALLGLAVLGYVVMKWGSD